MKEKGLENIQIVDIDVQTGGACNSVVLELLNPLMIEDFKKLDGTLCLGEPLR
jgi:hypothetical protein